MSKITEVPFVPSCSKCFAVILYPHDSQSLQTYLLSPHHTLPTQLTTYTQPMPQRYSSASISRHTRPLTVALQGKTCDLLKAHTMAQRLVKALEAERKEEKFHVLWQEIKKVAGTLNLEPAKKRTTSVQCHRVNPPVNGVRAHYRVSYFYYFLDHSISHLKTRFPAELEGALLGTYLLPSKIKFLINEMISKIKTEFKDIYSHIQQSLK